MRPSHSGSGTGGSEGGNGTGNSGCRQDDDLCWLKNRDVDNSQPTIPINPIQTPQMPSVTQPSPKNDGSPIVSIAGGLLLIQLGILDAVLGLGIVSVAICGVTVPGCQLGLAGELVLIPFEFLSLNLTLYAAQMATSGSTNHDPLPLLHATFPDLLPYNP